MTKKQAAIEKRSTQIPGAISERLPTLPTAVIDAKATREQMFTLRHFHLGDPGTKDNLEPVSGECLPALLDAFRDTSRLRYDYPLFLFPPSSGGDGHQDADALVCSFAQWLEGQVQTFAHGKDEARILKDHLPWLEYTLRQSLKEQEGPVPAMPALKEAGLALQKHLDLDPSNRDRLTGNLEKLQVAAGRGEVMGYGRFPSLHLLIHAVRSRIVPRRVRFQTEIDDCIRGLDALLEVEWGKSDESIEPRQARDSVGPAGVRFDPHALSSVMDHARGTREMAPERRDRIKRVLAILRDWRADPVLVRLIHLGAVKGAWLADSPDVEDEYDADPCARATDLFDREADKLTEVLSAVRIARLEIDRIYDPAIHDPWFANFDWEGFSRDELSLVPVVVAMEGADRVAGPDMRSFSRLLSSGRPVQILIRVQPSNNPGAGPDEDPFQDFRTELGYLGLSHRQAAVTQSSASRFRHLTECFLSSLEATRTSLHLINTGMRPTHSLAALNAWLVAGAAIEGRAHPFFRSYPGTDESVPSVMDFSGNPEQESDWPIHPFRYLDDSGNIVAEDLAFTFADYCLLIERLRGHYRLIPPGCDSDALVPMQEYLAKGADQAYRLVPFAWAVDGNGILHRLVVSRELAMACHDRLNFWRTLQQTAGVRNPYVDRAVEQTREEERQLAAEEREQLLTTHADEVERVRTEAAGEAMQRLTDVILGMDFAAGMPGGTFKTPAPAAKASQAVASVPAEPTPAEQATPAEEDEVLSFDEPWIDTPLCTSCNDCMKINPLLFVYNEEKQAMLGDLGSATFAHLVEAAVLCPAKCIHPGKPWNPDEPGLENLVERAAPYNQ